jgi:ketosteroid isomerase-like protein
MGDITTFLTDWTTAECDADTAALNQMLTDDFVGVGPLGFTLPKAAWLGRHQGGDLKYESFDLDELQVRTYADAALVIARQTAKGAYQGNPLPTDLRASLVLVRQQESWRLTGIHMSFIAGTPGAPPIPGAPT